MSKIDWDIVQMLAAKLSETYATKINDNENSQQHCAAYNGYFAGYMECAAERESLRVINERLQKLVDGKRVEKEQVLSPVEKLDVMLNQTDDLSDLI